MDPKPRKIALIGYAPNVRLAPWGDPTYEIWGLNDQPWTMPRSPLRPNALDVLFEIHKPDVIKAEGHWDRLKELTIPVYMQEHYPEIPTSVAYPLDMVKKYYTIDGTDKPFLTCSASLMLAVAIESKPTPTRIDLFGIDMAQDTEFQQQRPSAEFFLGVAHGLGIQISVQGSSDLLKTTFIYGFEDEQSSVFREQVLERLKWLRDMTNAEAAKEQQAHEARLQYQGAVSDIEHVAKRWALR